jgi:RHS repeat-associated protein
LLCIVLSYTLLFAFIAPLARTRVHAAGSSKVKAPMSQTGESVDTPGAREVLVRFRPEVTEQEKEAVATAKGARRGKQLRGLSRFERLELIGGQTPQQLSQQLAGQPGVEWVEPNYLIRRDDLTPTNARFAEQWALRNSGTHAIGQPGTDFGAAAAWEPTTGEPTTVVAVIDSGIDFTHPDLTPHQWTNRTERANDRDDDRDGYVDDLHGWDWVADSNQIRDEQGHGTSVAGLIAVEGNKAVGTTGVMWRAGLMSLRVLDATGTGEVGDAVEAIDYAVAHGAQVINLSWGLELESQALRDAIERAGERGVVVVCSAGNGGRNIDGQPYYPAAFASPNLLSVAASDSNDNLAGWSNWGATRVAVAAPGVELLTTQKGGDYGRVTGTSAAAPLVTGIAGLVRSEYPGLSAAQTRASIVTGARQVAGLSGKVAAGGVVQAAGALRSAGGMTPGNGGGNGNGQGQWHSQSPRPERPERGIGGRGPDGSFDAPASAPVKAAPANFLNQDEVRRRGQVEPQARAFIQSNSLPHCDGDCEGYSVGGAGGSDPYFGTARNLPGNRTGQTAGVDLGSRNFNWNTPLVSLPGRANLNFNVDLHYNSLVWTKQGNAIQYNADHGFPGPGFRLGLPTLQPRHYNSNTGTYAYNMVTSSGGRVEMKQLGASNTYESTDGSYTQLVEYYQIVARHSGKCLDVSTGSQSNGAPLHQWDCAGLQNQQWQLVPTDNGYYKIVSRHSGKAMDVAGAGQANGSGVHQWEYVGGVNQQWQIIPTDSGYSRIVARHSGKALDVAEISYANGGAIHQWDYVGGENQQWQLVPIAGQAVVRMSNGSQLTFVFNSSVNEYRCTQIKDSNGNFITINYGAINGNSTLGRPTSVVDTAGRTIYFNYDAQNYLSSITQAWTRETPSGVVSETHEWAKFYYGTVTLQPYFPGLSVVAPVGTAVPVLTRVDLSDKSSYQFEYEAAWGMVRRISKYGPDPGSRLLNYTSYNIPTNATAHSDCPRFTERRDWAVDWNAGAEAVTTYGVAENATWTMPGDSVPNQHSGTRVTVTSPVFYDKDNNARQVVEKVYSHATGWSAGLPLLSQTFEKNPGNGVETLQRQMTTGWTHDDPNLPYAKNPRPWEHNVYDPQGNRKRTAISYTSYSLPSIIYEYGADAQTLVRQTNFAYNLTSTYLDRRIIGLVTAKEVYEVPSNYTMVSRTTYDYDSTALENPGTVWQHDGAYYGAGTVSGRGNMTAVHRFDVTAPYDTTKKSSVSTGYDTVGNVVWTKDAENHQSNISYADNFSQGANTLNTRAYPTQMTINDPDNNPGNDPDTYSTHVKYNYDLGTVYLTTNPKGAAQKNQYDSAGRLLRVTSVVGGNDGFYTRYEYDPNWGHTRSYTPNEAGEAYTNSIVNGAGQVWLFVASHPNSTGGYLATQTKYDALGRAVEQSNPTEITGGGYPTGDDAAGYRFTKQAYDWKGRPTLTTFPVVTGQSLGNTKELTYGGCGCAGGETTTYRDERGRLRKLYKDVLGRLAKVEELHINATLYSTTTYTYNMRDQIININQQGQVRTMEYDGHGRLWKRTTPEQGLTTYLYNKDDTTQSITDARGVTTSFVHSHRHLLKQVNYTVPTGSGASPTSNVAYEYDAVGNRTSMTDGLGSMSYVYNTLSQLVSEKRTFNGVTGPNSGGFQLSYQYNLAGQLKRVTNPFNAQVAYTYDANGRVTDVKGTDENGYATYMGVPNYALNLRYRAFGGLKGLTYGNNKTLALNYDERLRLKTWDVQGVLGWNYSYNNFYENTHRVTYAKNISNYGTVNGDPTLDRSYEYDHVGRLLYAHTGVEARSLVGESTAGVDYGSYSQHVSYDVFGNHTARVGWGGIFGSSTNHSQSFQNNRRDGLTYDAAGNLTNDGAQYTYDALGQQTNGVYPAGWGGYANYSLQQSYDGDGLRGKKVDNGTPTYYLRSTVLGGQVVAEMTYQGNWDRGYVYLGGQLLLVQSGGVPKWVHQDPITKSQRLTDFYGNLQAVVDLDPWGGETSRSWQQWHQPHRYTSYERDGNGNDQAMFRQYNSYWQRFNQPDPYEGSYDTANPQSLNRYAYVQNDPVNLVDPSGLNAQAGGTCFTYGNFTLWEWPDGRSVLILNYTFTVCFGGGGGVGVANESAIGGGGGGSGAPPKKSGVDMEKVKAALNQCLGEMFGMSLTSFTPSEKGKNGHATMNRLNGTFPNGLTGFGVTNDNTTYTQAQLSALSKKVGGSGSGLGLAGHGVYNGMMLDAHTNYTASDRNRFVSEGQQRSGFPAFLASQIHELGNSVSYLTGIEFSNIKTRDKDPGAAFESCVTDVYKGRK